MPWNLLPCATMMCYHENGSNRGGEKWSESGYILKIRKYFKYNFYLLKLERGENFRAGVVFWIF